jgi:uncharacterized membrane protein
MNIHPLFVHFPIGILVLYGVLELIRTRSAKESEQFTMLKGFLAIVGTLAAYATLVTGEWAEEVVLQTRPELGSLIEMHSTFATTTSIIFTVLAASYVVYFFARSRFAQNRFFTEGWNSPIWRLKQRLARLVRETFVGQLLALAGLICATITGGLGAAIVYGPDVDPFVRYIYGFFF